MLQKDDKKTLASSKKCWILVNKATYVLYYSCAYLCGLYSVYYLADSYCTKVFM